MIKNNFPKLLQEKERAEGRYISLAEIAQETGIRRKTLYRWQNDQVTKYDQKVIEGLCKYFNVSLTELLLEEKPEKPKAKKPVTA